MFQIIAGGNETGYHLLKKMVAIRNEVVLIDRNQGRCNCINEEMGNLCICGDPCDPAILEKSGITRAEMIISCLEKDEDNLIVCQVARKKYRVPHTISLVNSPENIEVFHGLGVNAAVSTINPVLDRLEERISLKGALTLLAREYDIDLIKIRLNMESSAAGKSLEHLNLPNEIRVSGVIRNGLVLEVKPNLEFLSGDTVFVMSPADLAKTLRKAFLGSESTSPMSM